MRLSRAAGTPSGGWGFGYDMYSDYIQPYLEYVSHVNSILYMSIDDVSYFSITVYNRDTRKVVAYVSSSDFTNDDMTIKLHTKFTQRGRSIENPYINGNTQLLFSHDLTNDIPGIAYDISPSPSPTGSTVPSYRIDAVESALVGADGLAAGSCSDAYLVSWLTDYVPSASSAGTVDSKDILYKWGAIKIRLPSIPICVDSDADCKYPLQNTYDMQYFSISSNYLLDANNDGYGPPVSMNYAGFGVNGSILLSINKIADPTDTTVPQYGYVFWCPPSVLKNACMSAGVTSGGTHYPPYIKWGNTFAFILPCPNFLFVFRYKGIQTPYVGSPDNIKCSATSQGMVHRPISKTSEQGLNLTDDQGIYWGPEICGINDTDSSDWTSISDIVNCSTIGTIDRP